MGEKRIRRNYRGRAALMFAGLLLTACGADGPPASAQTPDQAHVHSPAIVVDQFGYLPALRKRAVIRQAVEGFDAGQTPRLGERFAVMNVKTNAVVYDGAAVAWNDGAVDAASGDRVWHFDFSAVQTPGTYKIIARGEGAAPYSSAEFEIRSDVYNDVLKTAFKTFYYQRAGYPKQAPFAAIGYRDGASHLGPGQDTEVRLFSAKDDASTARDLRGGWYDAGDYNKYTSWTANYVTRLIHTYLDTPAVWTDDFDIPESGNGVPDILDEVKWGLDWLERMQNDNGSLLSVMGLAEGSPPSTATGPSFYGPANTSGTLHAAGAFAMAAKYYADIPLYKDAAVRYADRAVRAWDWALDNPDVVFKNNDAEYGSERLAAGQQEVDDKGRQIKKMVAAIYLYDLTGERQYRRVVAQLYKELAPINPYFMDGFGGETAFALSYFARLDGVPRKLSQQIKADFADSVRQSSNGWPAHVDATDPYLSPISEFTWGSNSVKVRTGEFFVQAVVNGGTGIAQDDLINAAAGYVNYIHGVNPMGKVYLSNMGALGAENSVDSLYHAWFVNGSDDYDSVLSSTYGPLPGLLAGGPNPSYARDDCCKDICGGYGDAICKRPPIIPPSGQPPAKSYADFNDGWPLNSWSVTENSNSYQISYLRLLSKFASAPIP